MGNFNLYPHNKESYKQIRLAIADGEKRIALIQATGTGKSYNSLSLILDYQDKKALYVVPSLSIVEHLQEVIVNSGFSLDRDFPNLKFLTYQSFVNMSREEISSLPAELIVLDEFHHLGAPVWGERINYLVETHEKSLFLGLTAYPVRRMGSVFERDMVRKDSDEIFAGKVVREYDLSDALIDRVLPEHKYKTAIINLQEDVLQVEALAKKRGKLDEYQEKIAAAKKRIAEAPGIPELIKENIQIGDKVIYFCPVRSQVGINDVDNIMREAYEWFRNYIPDKEIVFYKTTSQMGLEGKKNRDAFYNNRTLDGEDAASKLKVMFAINQYNEGVHAPGVNKVIMGRCTSSSIVFFEQLGRALSASVKESPTIIDLSGNYFYMQELERQVNTKIEEYRKRGISKHQEIDIPKVKFDIEILNKNIFELLTDMKLRLSSLTWDEWFCEAKKYYKEHKDLLVPSSYVTKEGLHLGKWISNQRVAYQNRKIEKDQRTNSSVPLTDNQVELLESIGMSWEVYADKWNLMYEAAKKYYVEHGNLIVPRSYVTKEGLNLGTWISNQRKAYQNRKISKDQRTSTSVPLTDNQVELLESIGMSWNVSSDKWNIMYEAAKKYYVEQGNLLVPSSYVTKEGLNLGTWIVNQRKAYQNRKISKAQRTNNYVPLTDNQVELLESIGMSWEVYADKWNLMYEAAKKYYVEQGNLLVPSSYVTKEGLNLGTWIVNQRKAYQNCKIYKALRNNNCVPLTDNQVELLESISMVWNVSSYRWNIMYEAAKSYYEEHGNLLVPSSYVTKEGLNLGRWIATQRNGYQNREITKAQRTNKSVPLTDNQVELLESICMVWEVRKNKEEIERLCDDYKVEYSSDYSRIPSLEFKAKLEFLKNLGVSDAKIKEGLLMSNKKFKNKYNVDLNDLINNEKKRG